MLTQTELAQRAGLTKVTVYRLETGHHAANPKSARQLAQCLSISLEDLVSAVPEASVPAQLTLF
jgi:DNA-binding XRE family transcriptional regulator